MTTLEPVVHARLAAAMASNRPRVLIAEDDAVSATLLSSLLAQFGCETIVVPDGEAAWQLFDREPVRLIISDWRMPGLDGLALCERVRERPKTPYTYFILLTASHTSDENYALATDAGVDDFLSKPLTAPMIRLRLRVAERILKFTAELRQLREIIPMCVYCRKVRDERDYWERVETYIQNETGSRFSHGACPECCEEQAQRLSAAADEERARDEANGGA